MGRGTKKVENHCGLQMANTAPEEQSLFTGVNEVHAFLFLALSRVSCQKL